MFSKAKIKAMKRLKKEYEDLITNPIANIGACIGLVDDDNIFEWKCSLTGPRDTSYSNGIFFLRVKFPDDYPENPPEVAFKTPIYHININPHKLDQEGAESLGHVCISTLNWWKERPTTMKEVLKEIFALFYLANPDSPYGLDRADEFRYNRDIYESKVQHFTKKYAFPNVTREEYDTDWDFSIP